MKMLITTTALILFAALASAQEIEHEASVSIESGRLFEDQGLVLFEGTTLIGDYTISYDGWYVNAWHAQTNTREANETDVCAGKTGELSERTSYDTSICFFEIAGPEAYQFEVAFDHSLTDEWSLSGRFDVIGGGFETEVGYLGFAYARDWFDADAGVSYDTWSKDTVLQGGFGISFPFAESTALRLFAKGFTVLEEGDPLQSDDEDGFVSGASLAHSF